MKKVYLSLVLLLGSTQIMRSQDVTTYAGTAYTGTGQYTQTTANKLSRYFSAPLGLLVDTTVNIMYIGNQHNIIVIQGDDALIRAGSPGDPTLNAGYLNGLGINSRVDRPAGMALDADRNVIFCDQNNTMLRKMDKFVNRTNPSQVTDFAGVQGFTGGYKDGAYASAEFSGPQDIIAMGTDFYVADRDNNCIRKLSGGTVSTIAGDASASGDTDGTGTAAKFWRPTGLCVEDADNILIADSYNGMIRRLNVNTGAVTTVVTGLENPQDVAVFEGKIFIADETSIQVYENSSLTVYAGSTTQAGNTDASGAAARFRNLTNIVYHPKHGALYAIDQGNNTVRKITYSSTSDVEEVEANNFTIYPNPANDVLSISGLDNTAEANVELVDMTGKIVKQFNDLDSTDLNIEDVPAGLYIVKITCGQQVKNQKLVIK